MTSRNGDDLQGALERQRICARLKADLHKDYARQTALRRDHFAIGQKIDELRLTHGCTDG